MPERGGFFRRIVGGIRDALTNIVGGGRHEAAPTPSEPIEVPPVAGPQDLPESPGQAEEPFFPDVFGIYEPPSSDITSDEGYPIGSSEDAQDELDVYTADLADQYDETGSITVVIEMEFENPSPPPPTIIRTVYATFSGEEARQYIDNPSYAAAISQWVNNPDPGAHTYHATLVAGLSADDWIARAVRVIDFPGL